MRTAESRGSRSGRRKQHREETPKEREELTPPLQFGQTPHTSAGLQTTPKMSAAGKLAFAMFWTLRVFFWVCPALAWPGLGKRRLGPLRSPPDTVY